MMKENLNRLLIVPRKWLLLFFLGLISIGAFAQQITVSGTITSSEDGMPIPGVSVFVKGTTNGTITDIDGKYGINTKLGDVLVYSFIGMMTQEIPVSKSVVNVKMKPETIGLEQVVVVGYGQQKKKSVVGSITQTKGDELLKAGSVTTVSEALTGLLPGVTTMQAAGQPGSTAADILIRGRGSWTGNSAPLFLVDGVERDFNNLDPNEIESISVLKDASATAVYGVKGANGVILVTTKSGQKGKPKVSFSANVGIKDPTIDTDYATDMATNLEYYNLAKMNDHNYSLYPAFYINRFRDPAYADNPFYQYTSFINDLFGTGYTQQYNLNISGGNDFVKYFTSFGYNYDGDIFDIEEQPEFDPRTYQKRFNWRTNLDFSFTKSTKFSVKLSGDMTNWNGNHMTKNTKGGVTSGGGDIMRRIYSTSLLNAPAVYEDGKLGYDINNSINVNYLGMMEREGSYSKKSNRLYTDFILSQDITKHLKASGKFSYNYYRNYLSDISKRWNDAPIYYFIPTSDGYNPVLDENGEVVKEPIKLDDWENPARLANEDIDGFNSDIYYEFALNYDQKFGRHDVSALALFQRRKYKNKVSFPRYEESWVGRVTYGFADKYLFEANGAYNGNENFAPGQRFGFFPSVAVGWVLSEESFIMDKLSFLDFFKIKYSYGTVGADQGLGNDDRFRYLSSYASNTMPFEFGYLPSITGGNNSGLVMYTEGQPPVLDVSWETSIKQNLGFEINTLANRLQTSLDLFQENRKDILMKRRVIPEWFGNEPPFANIGETKNHGFDLELNWNDKIGSDFSYWLKGNISISENRIVERDDPLPTPEYRKEEGKSIGWNYGYQSLGILQSWDEVYASTPTGLISSDYFQPGDLQYNDYNADGVIDSKDIVPIGHPSYATKSFAFSFGAKYKNLSLTVMFNGMWDISKRVSNNYLFAYDTNSSLGFMLKNNEQKDSWTPWNTDTDTPVMHTTESDYYRETSSYSLRNSSFLRLRNVELKYNLPKRLIDRTGFFDNVEFYVNGNNLYTWQKLPRAFDPEAKQLEVYPITKRYNIGCRFSF